MALSLQRLGHSRIMRGIGANIYVQIILTVAQLSLVPVFAAHWGLKVYGLWLLLYSVPSYLAITDFGLAKAATAEMTALVAKGQHEPALAVYQAARLTTLLINLAIVAVVWVVALCFAAALHAYDPVTHGNTLVALMLLAVYGAISLQNGVTIGAFTATGGYARSGYITGTTFALETLSACVVVMRGGHIIDVAWSYLICRSVGTAAMAMVLRRDARWITQMQWRATRADVRRLLSPAIALVTLTGGNALIFQGTVSAIGLAAGVQAVPAFTTVRTLSRLAVQAILIVNHSVMPAFSVANATHDHKRMAQLSALSIGISLVSIAVVFPGLLLLGRWFVGVWTHGVVHPDMPMLVLMGISMSAFMVWQPLANLIMSINQQGRFAYFYFWLAVVGTGLCVVLAHHFGANGAAMAVMVSDIVMAGWILRVAVRVGILDWAAVRAELLDLRGMIALAVSRK